GRGAVVDPCAIELRSIGSAPGNGLPLQPVRRIYLVAAVSLGVFRKMTLGDRRIANVDQQGKVGCHFAGLVRELDPTLVAARPRGVGAGLELIATASNALRRSGRCCNQQSKRRKRG